MQKDKLIIFDWGGVVESHDSEKYNCYKARLDFFKSLGVKIPENEIYKCYNLVKDRNSKEGLFNRLKEKFHLTCDMDEFTRQYNYYFFKVDYYKEVVSFAHSLRRKCKIGILSNLNPFDKVRINRQMDLSKFDYVWLSFELNCRKPKEEIYNIVERSIDIDSENILFIDDKIENLQIPEKRGWQVCHASGKELDKIKKKIEIFLKQ